MRFGNVVQMCKKSRGVELRDGRLAGVRVFVHGPPAMISLELLHLDFKIVWYCSSVM